MKTSYTRRAAIIMLIIAFAAPGVVIRAQGYRVNVYNPNVYNRTRQPMSNRAAVRAALKRERRRAAEARRRGRAAQ